MNVTPFVYALIAASANVLGALAVTSRARWSVRALETMVAPFEQNIVVLCRNYATRIHPGDYGFMMGNAAAATTYTD